MVQGPETMRFGEADHLVHYVEPIDGVSVATVAFKQSSDCFAYAITEGVSETECRAESGIGTTRPEAFDALAAKIMAVFGDQMHRRPSENDSDEAGRFHETH